MKSPFGLKRAHALLAVLGAIHALSFAPGPLPAWALPFVQIFVLAAVFLQLQRAASMRLAASLAFVFGLCNFSLGLYWLFISMHSYGGLAAPLAALGVLALAAFLGLFTTAAAVLARWVTKTAHPPASHTWHRQVLTLMVWASAWTALEWLRGVLFTGFPWMNTGYAHIEGVLAPWAPLVGVYGVAWLGAFASAAIAALARDKDSANDARAAVGVGLAILTGLAGIGLSHTQWTHTHGEPLIVRLVQGNVPQSEKFDPALMQQGIQHYLELAALAPKAPDGKPDIIVLPETVVPIFQDQLTPAAWRQWLHIAALHDATLLMGVPLRDAQRNRYTNSAIAFDADTPLASLMQGTTPMRYDKHHLVPFGEFVPRGFRWFVDAMHIPLGDFDRGQSRQRLFAIGGQQFSPDVCYEDVFGEEIIQTVRDSDTLGPGATILVNISNLAWFGDSWALRQHLQISRMRALESGRPMLRATNTGMTAAIAPDGTVRAVLAPLQPGVLDVEVQGMRGRTPYVRWGNGPVLIWIFIVLAFALTLRRKACLHGRKI